MTARTEAGAPFYYVALNGRFGVASDGFRSRWSANPTITSRTKLDGLRR
jgi:hypothetical protein